MGTGIDPLSDGDTPVDVPKWTARISIMKIPPRRHSTHADDVPVYCSGRWGPRRVRVEECTVPRAEDT